MLMIFVIINNLYPINNHKIMGNQNNSSLRNLEATQLSYIKDEQAVQSEWQQVVQHHQCCFIKYQTKKRRRLLWQQNFIKNCKTLRTHFYWTDDLVHALTTNNFQRVVFIKEVNELRFINIEIVNKKEKQVLLTPSEINQFKKNLKKSVLVSHSSVLKSPRYKQGQRVVSVIPPMASISAALTQGKHQRQNTGKVKESRLANAKKVRGATRIENFRKSVIVNQRQNRNSLSSSRSKSALRQSLISFVDDTLSSVFRSEKQVTKQGARNLQVFIRFSVILQQQLSVRSHPINIIIRTFKNEMYKKFGINHQNKQITEQLVSSLVDNIKSFISLLNETIFDFYNLSRFEQNQGSFQPNQLITSEQNLSTLISTIIFKDQKFYGLIIDLVIQFNRKRQLKFEKLLEAKGTFISPESLQVQDAYCLTVRTLRKHMQKESVDSKLQNFDLQDLSSQVGEQVPYHQSIQTLKGIAKSKSPVSKMKVIMECSQSITEAITKFYNNHNMEIKHWVLDADQILSIFCYIICNARVPNLHSHLYLLQHFSTDHQLISVTGYYYSVLMCALQQVQSTFDRELYLSEHIQKVNI